MLSKPFSSRKQSPWMSDSYCLMRQRHSSKKSMSFPVMATMLCWRKDFTAAVPSGLLSLRNWAQRSLRMVASSPSIW